MKIKKFTLVELLVVIAIIGMLTALLLPSVSKAIEEAKRTKTYSEVSALASAVEQYINTYGVPPLLDGHTTSDAVFYGGTEVNASKNYDKLIVGLAVIPIKNSEDEIITMSDAREINRKKYNFLSLIPEQTKRGYTDPWGTRYRVLFNAKMNREGISELDQDLVGNVFVYSFGANRRDDLGFRQETGGDNDLSDADDIASWDVKPREFNQE